MMSVLSIAARWLERLEGDVLIGTTTAGVDTGRRTTFYHPSERSGT